MSFGWKLDNPEVVGVADRLRLGADPWNLLFGEQPRVALALLGIHHVHVEWRIGHDVVALADEVLPAVVDGVALLDVSLKSMYRQVHPS